MTHKHTIYSVNASGSSGGWALERATNKSATNSNYTSCADYTGNTSAAGSTEGKPNNFTYKVWVRTA